MRLNPDCIRDILLTVESSTNGIDCPIWPMAYFQSAAEFPRLHKYSVDEVWGHVEQCRYHGYFVGDSVGADGYFTVLDLSPKGHEFLANIRDDTNWKQTLKKCKDKIGSISIPVLQSAASEVIVAALRSRLD